MFSYYLDVEEEKWLTVIQGMPLVYEVFAGDGEEFLQRLHGTRLSIQHGVFARNPFSQSMTTFDLQQQLGITREIYGRHWQQITLGITTFDLRYGYPAATGLRVLRRSSTCFI
jgi:hypothetical protein